MIEKKFEFDRRYIHEVEALIRRLCRPDPLYPETYVYSIYLDDLRMRSLYEKRNSDFLKGKVRVRWYQDTLSNQKVKGVYLETKSKEGVQRSKERWYHAFPDPIDVTGIITGIRGGELREWISQKLNGLNWAPVLGINYRRQRFEDYWTDARINLDNMISGWPVSRVGIIGDEKKYLDKCVLEVKDQKADLDRHLTLLFTYGRIRKAAFSKYLRCYRLFDDVA